MRFKILPIYILICLCTAGTVHAQCPNGMAPQQVSQSENTGMPDETATFPFAQFDPSLGTLTGVSIRAKVTGVIRMTVFNYNTTPRQFNVTVDRTDYFTSPGLGVYIVMDTSITYATPVIPESWYPGTPPNFNDREPNDDYSNMSERMIIAPLQQEIYQNITDPGILANYVGAGAIELEYALDPGYTVRGVGSSQTESRITTFSTQIELEVIYTYCPHAILPEGKLSFGAAKGDGNNVLLTWAKEQETNGIQYTPEISKNGRDFVGITSIESQQTETTVARYDYHYRVPVIEDYSKLYFRLKQTNPEGKTSYSEVVTLSYANTSERLSIYPNPAKTNFTVTFDTPQRNMLSLALINSMGQVVETEAFNPGGGKIHNYRFKRNHVPGVYFVRIVNTSTQQQQVLRLAIE